MNLKVCLDIRAAQTGAKHTGTGVYTTELVRTLQGISHNFEIWYLVLSNYPLPELNLPLDRLVKVWRPSKPERWHVVYDEILQLDKQLKQKGFDLVHLLVPGVIKPRGNMKVVTTVLDLIPLIFPRDDIKASIDWKWLYKKKLKSVSKASHLIAISEATKQDIIEYLKIQSEKVSVVYLAPKSDFYPKTSDNIRALRKRISLPDCYILYLGGYSPRKNMPFLIHSYCELRELRKTVKLVLAGSIIKEVGYSLRDLLKDLDLRGDVVLAGHIPDSDLPVLYSGALCFVYPSLYEGFGLPVLEAMACGTPVVASRAGSLAEVVGDAALLIEPDDEVGLADIMKQVIENPLVRADLKHRGLERAAVFSWERCALETLAVYRQVLNDANRN